MQGKVQQSTMKSLTDFIESQSINYYMKLIPEKKHQQDTDAINLLNSL